MGKKTLAFFPNSLGFQREEETCGIGSGISAGLGMRSGLLKLFGPGASENKNGPGINEELV